MPQVILPILGIPLGKSRGVVDHQQVLGITFLRTLGEIETAGDDSLPVNHHDLVVGDLVDGIDVGRHSLIGEESG